MKRTMVLYKDVFWLGQTRTLTYKGLSCTLMLKVVGCGLLCACTSGHVVLSWVTFSDNTGSIFFHIAKYFFSVTVQLEGLSNLCPCYSRIDIILQSQGFGDVIGWRFQHLFGTGVLQGLDTEN